MHLFKYWNLKSSNNIYICRTSQIFQPTFMWVGRYIACWRMAYCSSQHQHVHLRNRTSFHPHGTWVSQENARDYWVILVKVLFCQLIFIFRFENGDSILAPGGSVSNMYALMIARHKAFPQHKKYGMRAIKGQLIMYTSQHVNSFVFDSSNPNLVLISASLFYQGRSIRYRSRNG